MKILLVGEYNRTHWNIKEGLNQLGHTAITVGMKDGFKKVDVDIEIKNPFENFLPRKFKHLFYRIFKIDLLGKYVYYTIKSKKEILSGFDVIQFISKSTFVIDDKSNLSVFKLFSNWNKNVFTLSAGYDYPSITYAYAKKFRYSILTPYFENPKLEYHYRHILRYITNDYKSYHDYIYSKINGIIASDLDYHIPLDGYSKYLGLIPHAINTKLIKYSKPKIGDKIIIFLGINTNNYYMKGGHIFEDALQNIKNKFGHKVEIIKTKNLPYKTYIEQFKTCHILLDQAYSYDLGYNALEAMAMGKVVFSGAEKEWQKHYNIKEDSTVINALPDAEYISNKLEWLINNPEYIIEISSNARRFVEKHHNHINCAKQYLTKWGSKT